MHGPGHHHGPECGSGGRARHRRRLAWTLVLTAGYMVAEIVGGLLSNSLALLADAGHMFSDVAALGLSLFAMWIAERPAPSHRTFGYYRAEILAAMVNGATLLAVSVYIVVEAVERFSDPPEVAGGLMMGIAVGGLIVNLIGMALLHAGQGDSLNMRGAWLHLVTDALGSVATIAAGGAILLFHWEWFDIVASIVIALLVLYSSWRLVADAASVLMEAAPRGIDVDAVFEAIRGLEGVREVHDLHVWTITSGRDSLSAHVVVADGQDHPAMLTAVRTLVHQRFGIDHVTIQVEPAGFDESGVCL